MKTFKFSSQTGALYFWVGIIFILIGAGLIVGGIIYFLAINNASDIYNSVETGSSNYQHQRGDPILLLLYPIGMVVGGIVLLGLGFSMFNKILKQRFTKFVITEESIQCQTFGKEVFNIPFDKLGFSESQYSSAISDRRDKSMYMVTSDIENYEEFVEILKRKSEGFY